MPNNITAEEIAEFIDLDSALKRVRGNKTLYKRMLGMFTQSEEFEAFEKSLADGDTAHAAEVAHGIKGMSANLGMMPLSDISATLMVKLREGAADAGLIDSYRKALEKTRECVDALTSQLG